MTHLEVPQQRRTPAGASVAVIVCMVLTLAGCSSSEPDPIPQGPQTPATSEPSDPASSEPSWEDKYSASELVTYEAALQRWTEYFTRTDAIYKRGKDTPQARAALREYSMTWQVRVQELAGYDAGDVQITVPVTRLSSRAISIEPNVVVIGQCTDYSHIVVLQHGKKVKGTKPDHLKTELVIEMNKTPGRGWMVANTELKDKTSCAK